MLAELTLNWFNYIKLELEGTLHIGIAETVISNFWLIVYNR